MSKPDATRTSPSQVGRPELETVLACIWEHVLGVNGISRNDNFFDLGGHSLLATQIVSRIRAALHVEVPVASIFDHPSVAELAEVVAASPTLPADELQWLSAGNSDRQETFPLSFSQERMWFLHHLHPNGSAYNLVDAIKLNGPLDTGKLEWALNQLIAHHESLRTAFVADDGTPRQRILPELRIEVPVIDYRSLPRHERWARMERAIRQMGSVPFDLGRPPLLRVRLYRWDEEEHALAICLHHIVSDSWSFGVLSREVGAFYRAARSGESSGPAELQFQHVEFVRWHRQWVAGGAITPQLDYWRRQLSGLPVTELPADRPRPPIQTDRGATVSAPIPPDVAERICSLCREGSTSPFMVMLAAFDALLHRYTNAEDIAVGVPIANRNWLHSEAFIASFVNTLVFRVDLSGNPSFRDLVDRVKHTTLDAVAHQDVPFEQLVEEIRPHRDPSRSPLFQILFNMTNAPVSLPDLGDVRAEVLPPITLEAAQFDLSFSVDWSLTRQVVVEYNADLFDAPRIERLLVHYWTLLEGAVADPGCRLGALPLLSGWELAEAERWAGSVGEPADGAGVGELIETQVARTPDAVAVRFENECLSFGELNAQANRLARHLVVSGVGPGDVVGVCLERSLDMVVAVLAVLKSGGAFVPLDPAYPPNRLEFMVADAGARLVVTNSELLARSRLRAKAEYVCLDLDDALIGGYAGENLGVGGAGGDLAYVIYTSGSTGRPKGVQVEQRSLVNELLAMAKRPGLTAGDVVLSVTTLSFDPALVELLVPLVVGAEVVVGRHTAVDAAALARELDRSGATMLQATPSTWKMLIEAGWRGDGRLKALSGGEVMSRQLADQLLARCGSVWNIYGPTETTVWSTVAEVTAGEGPVPIGTPIDNARLYVLDAHRQLLPVGLPGELFIGGEGVARGYRDRPDLADRFLPDPFRAAPGARMYRTGDLVRRLPDGNIEFLGRIDTQLKVRGYRIEPGEIEAVLVELPEVVQAVVCAHQHGPDDTRLTAYLVSADPATPPCPERLRVHLRSKLPDYMVPAAYLTLAALPTTPTNKIDRAQLPKPETTPIPPSHPPRHGLETELTRIWEDVLGVNGISRNDNFFDLGGHSFLALRLFARVETLIGRRPPLSALFRAPTIAELAALLNHDDDRPRWTSLVPVQTGGDRRPFFYVSPFLTTALSFSQLARHLGSDQPLYVLQPQGMEHDDPFHGSVEEMAAHYLEEMKDVQSSGPYWLGGHCAGSFVAFEMARQLQERGEEIGLLVVADSEPPGVPPPSVNRTKYVASRLAQFWWDGRLLPAVTWKLRIAAELTVVRRYGRKNGQHRRVADLRALHARAHRAYRPGMVRGDAVLIRSSEYAELRSRDWHLQWEHLVSGRLKVVVVPGTHAELSRDGTAMARAIRAEMGATAFV
jgi:amino acid adenylation domain-containing protein